MKKSLAILLCLLLALSAHTAAFAETAEPIMLTALWNSTGSQMNEENSVMRAIEEATGIRLICSSSAEYATKLSTLIASNDLPDMFSAGGDQAMQLRDNGYLMDIAPYLKEFAPNLYAELEDVLFMSQLNEDGKVYGLFSAMTWYPSALAVRSDYLEAVGMDIPSNIDEFYDVLKAFTHDDPDGNGMDDTYGIAYFIDNLRSFEYTFGAWGIPVGNRILLEDGTVTTYMKHPRYLEVIEFLRKLYQEGLMDPDFATYSTMDWFGRLWEGKTGCFDFQSVGTTNNWYPGRYTQTPVPTFDFAVIEGPYGDKGCVKQYPSVSSYTLMVSSKCKNPEAVAKLLEYTNSEEGQIITCLGVEGLHFNWVDREAYTYERTEAFKEDTAHRADGGYLYYAMFSMYFSDNLEVRMLTPLTQRGIQTGQQNPIDYAFLPVTLEADTEYGSTLTSIEKECLAGLIITSGDVEAEYQAYVERWENEGGLELEEEATSVYHELNS